ncbi:MAG TPA: hypothetical protein VIH11_07990 [Gemmatimonadaceae bacterium]
MFWTTFWVAEAVLIVPCVLLAVAYVLSADSPPALFPQLLLAAAGGGVFLSPIAALAGFMASRIHRSRHPEDVVNASSDEQRG